MNKILYIILMCLLGTIRLNAQSDSLVVKLYSGFGEHTIKPGYHILYKLNYREGYLRSKITGLSPDSVFLKNHQAVSLRHISEIGYYGKQDKVIKYLGVGMFALSGFLVYRYAVEQYVPGVPLLSQAGGLGWSIIPLITGTAMITLKRRTYKIPNPWQLQVSRDIPLNGFDFK